jgi:hypothetical protein
MRIPRRKLLHLPGAHHKVLYFSLRSLPGWCDQAFTAKHERTEQRLTPRPGLPRLLPLADRNPPALLRLDRIPIYGKMSR